LIIFNNNGEVSKVNKFGSDLYRMLDVNCGAGVEIPSNVWHTVIALSRSAILLEIKKAICPLIGKGNRPMGTK